jgi:hypothetical protein
MLPGASVVRLHHYDPVIDGRISKLPGELLVFQRFLHLQHFLLDSVSRDGQDVGVRTAYRPQQVNDGRHDSGKLQQGPRVDAEAAAGDAAELDDAVVAVRDSGVFELPLNYNLPQNRMMKESESKVPRHSGTMGARSDAWSQLE